MRRSWEIRRPTRTGILSRNEAERFRPGGVLLSKWACGVPAVVSSVSDRDPSALREMGRLGVKQGVEILVEAGTRSASVLVRIGGCGDPVRLSQRLAAGISVVSGP